MSSGEENIFYCVANMLDGLRHTPKALQKDMEYLSYGDGFKCLYRLSTALMSKRTILLNSFRFCDRYIAHIALYLGCKVIILQHGRNEYFESTGALLMIKKTLSEPRYKYELLFLLIAYVWFSLVRIKRKKLTNNSFCKLLYFTTSYKDLWVKALENVNVKIVDLKVNAPNPTTWGTETPIVRIPNLPVFLVDEPLDVTIGMTNESFFKLIDELSASLNIDKIYTKRHPRSNPEKFKKRPNIVEIDEVPENVKILIGYKSNLLFCGISVDKFYQFNQDSLREVNTAILKGTSNPERRDYFSLSKEDFICV